MVRADFSRGLLLLGGFRADGAFCMIALGSLSEWLPGADQTIHSCSCEDWEHFHKGVPCSSQMETKFVFLHLHGRVSKHPVNIIEMLYGRKVSENLGPRLSLLTDQSSVRVHGVHAYLANSTTSGTGRRWTIISKFLPNAIILCLRVTETSECSWKSIYFF